MDYPLHLLILIAFYTLLAQTLNLASGLTGLISLAHAGFYGIGAYTTALLSVNYQLSFWVNLPIAMFLCACVAVLVSLIALRTAEDYFIICTLGIQVIIFSLLNNWMSLTRGPLGIPAIPSVSIGSYPLDSKLPFLILSLSFTALVWYLLQNLSQSGFGKILKAISEDEIFTQSLGKNVYRAKITTFTLSAAFAAIPGALYAHYISYIDPTSFTVSESIFILSIVIIGGVGNMRGSFYAAAFMVLLPEALRFVGFPDSIAANVRQMVYGGLLILVVAKGDIWERVSKFLK